MSNFIEVSAGSGYGRRYVLYEVVSGHLVLRHEGDHDNLAGNDEALSFEGLTTKQAQRKAKAINDEPVGHSYDGCHACQFSVSVTEVDPPDWYTYREPGEAEVIRKALEEYRENR